MNCDKNQDLINSSFLGSFWSNNASSNIFDKKVYIISKANSCKKNNYYKFSKNYKFESTFNQIFNIE
jgi:hypothetical protein